MGLRMRPFNFGAKRRNETVVSIAANQGGLGVGACQGSRKVFGKATVKRHLYQLDKVRGNHT
jgi:hypothetical protein